MLMPMEVWRYWIPWDWTQKHTKDRLPKVKRQSWGLHLLEGSWGMIYLGIGWILFLLQNAHQIFVLEEKNQVAGHLKCLSEIKCLSMLIYLNLLFPELASCRGSVWLLWLYNLMLIVFSDPTMPKLLGQGLRQSLWILYYPVPQAGFRIIYLGNENCHTPFLLLVVLESCGHTLEAYRNQSLEHSQ